MADVESAGFTSIWILNPISHSSYLAKTHRLNYDPLKNVIDCFFQLLGEID